MELRRRLVSEVLGEGCSLSGACLRAGVTPKTGRKWVNRARSVGIENLREESRAPHRVARRTEESLESALVSLKETYPEWGAKKLVTLLKRDQGLLLPLRTAEHILKRRGLTTPPPVSSKEVIRFERETCGMLLQMDFKGLPQCAPYSILTVLDDHARYCFSFSAIPDKTAPSVQMVLWDLFGHHGLPKQMLMDNGDCWGTVQGLLPTRFEVWLMKLGVEPIHGRPRHPQTQGKVERFHKTAKTELREKLIQPSLSEVQKILRPFVDRYNWVRPHEALGGKTPGSAYQAFSRARPAELLPPLVPLGAETRKVSTNGIMKFRNQEYRLGKGLIGESVVLTDTEQGWKVSFNGFDLIYLQQTTRI